MIHTETTATLTATLTAERLDALRKVVVAGFIEQRYCSTVHFYLHNTGYLRSTTRLLKDPRYSKVPVPVYVPTPKGKSALDTVID